MADDIDERLRQQLQQAAGLAPEFHWDAKPAATRGTFRRRRWLLPMAVAAAVVLIIGIGAAVSQLIGSSTRSSGASCAAVLTFRGRQYEPFDAVRIPQAGRDLGTATTCSDTVTNGTPSPADQVPAVAAAGISAEWAFLYDGQLWVADRQAERPAAIDRLQQPLRCRSGIGKLSGEVVALDGRPLDESPPTAAPYTMTLRVTGDGLTSLAAERYRAVLIQVHVTGHTVGANLVARIADESGRRSAVTVRLSCSGRAFHAQQLRLG